MFIKSKIKEYVFTYFGVNRKSKMAVTYMNVLKACSAITWVMWNRKRSIYFVSLADLISRIGYGSCLSFYRTVGQENKWTAVADKMNYSDRFFILSRKLINRHSWQLPILPFAVNENNKRYFVLICFLYMGCGFIREICTSICNGKQPRLAPHVL